MTTINRYCTCPICDGSGRDNEDIKDECYYCYGQGKIDNPAYWRAILPKPIPFKEGREAYIEYYNQKQSG